MRDTQRANYIFIIGFVVSVLVVTGGALVFAIPDISQWPGNHHQNNLPVSSSTSLPDQPASLDDWVAYQHVGPGKRAGRELIALLPLYLQLNGDAYVTHQPQKQS